jgi:glycosyltransferase involved in cell wall biosynthesis
MKVAVISNFFPPDFVGGAEIYAYRLGSELAKMGVDVNVITSTKGRKQVEEYDGMRVHRITRMLPFSRFTGNFVGYNFNPYSYSVKKALDEIKPDVIHMHNIHTTFMLYPLTRFLKGPAVMHVHDHWPICYVGTLYNTRKNEFCDEDCARCGFKPGFRLVGGVNLGFRRRLVPQFEKKVSLFITPSSYLRQRLLENGFSTEDKVIHMPLGIDLREFSPGSGDERNECNIIFIGRLAPYKNPTLVVRILPELLKHVNCNYQVVGKGPDKERVRELARELGVDDHVELHGGLDFKSLSEKVRRASVLVVPSLWHENSPVVIYEALASGTPVIVSNLGGPKELIDEGRSGFSIDPLDEKGWMDAILKIVGDSELRTRMGIEARKKAEREYNIRENAKKMLGIYERVIEA